MVMRIDDDDDGDDGDGDDCVLMTMMRIQSGDDEG